MKVAFALEVAAPVAAFGVALGVALGDLPEAAVVASALLEVPAPLEPVWDAAVL